MTQPDRPIYLDCNATTPIDLRVRDVVMHYMEVEFGNAGSRTHIYGQEASKAVRKSREQIAAVVDARPEDVIFTSGATEANNLAILGLKDYGEKTSRKHIISTQIEHDSVLGPLNDLASRGFRIEFVPPKASGQVEPVDILRRLRADTLLVSVMHVNNETGVVQPISHIAEELRDHDALFHVDAAQGFGKEFQELSADRIDFISASAHKLHGPKGIGSLIVSRAKNAHKIINARQYGGGQERKLRPGTLPVALITGFGLASELAACEYHSRRARWEELRHQMRHALPETGTVIHGDPKRTLPTTLNFRFRDMDSDLVILQLRTFIAISNGSACSSDSIEPSHVISAMYPDQGLAHCACRASWCHLTPDIPGNRIYETLQTLL